MVGRRCRWFSVVLVVGIGCWCLCTSGKSIANCNQLRLRFEIEDARESGGYGVESGEGEARERVQKGYYLSHVSLLLRKMPLIAITSQKTN